ncbi:20S proteasome alpha type-1 subunit [Spraguea lophii 42_110]|uniref:20S proteasome alpha type-1 subunit n=1 Tax=Spraguea lophii (strain 42_110) TaxID=1358809 RepID=S7W8K2_SPRLO|nr:20S proteasome alpha type-1 subunit [Spraguea lophii 42_110]
MSEVYDNYSIFAPEGKVRSFSSVENTVSLGNICLGIVSKDYGIIIGYMGEDNGLQYLSPKIHRITNNSIFSFAGITNDGLEIVNYLLHKSVEEDVGRDRELDPMCVFDDYSFSAAEKGVFVSKRLCGAGGMLLSWYNNNIYLVEISPLGVIRRMKASAMGHRSQSAKTILQKSVEEINSMDLKELIHLGVDSIKNTNVKDVHEHNLDVWVVDKNGGRKIDVEELKNILK